MDRQTVVDSKQLSIIIFTAQLAPNRVKQQQGLFTNSHKSLATSAIK